MDHHINIYISHIPAYLDNNTFHHLLSLVKAEKAAQILRYKFKPDAIRSLYGELLLISGLKADFQIDYSKINICKNKYGKPFIENQEDIYYNLSHSGEWVVCALHTNEIGVDVEQVKTIDFDFATHFFTKSESDFLFQSNYTDQTSAFYDLWTLKEAYIKYKGKGLSIPLDSFSFTFDPDPVFHSDTETKKLYFKLYPVIEGYQIAVCSGSNCFPRTAKPIDLPDYFGIV